MKITRELRDPGEGLREPDPENLHLQRELKAVGHAPAGKLDGRFGDNTTIAVREFARRRNARDPKPEPPLREDGVVDDRYAAALNAEFYATPTGRIVKDREDQLALKRSRIQQIKDEIKHVEDAVATAESVAAKDQRLIELRTRLHTWLERLAKELEKDLFDGFAGYKQTASHHPPTQEGEFVSMDQPSSRRG